MEDRQLIYDFVTQNSEKAFRELVDRYINLVHSTAFREVRDSQIAEEVSQAVFILLARKAGSFTEKTVVSGWLYRTTRFVAARALRAELRRRRHEQEAFQMQQNASSDETWRSLEPAIDEGMGQLGRKDRDAVLLRYFQEEPLGAVGEKLGISEEAARKRIDRSLEKLRRFFSRRGIKVTAGAVAAALVSHNVVAVPPSLAGSIATQAFAKAIGSAGMPLLVRETLNAWRMIKTVTVGAAVVGVVGCLFLVHTIITTPQRSIQQAPGAMSAKAPTAAVTEATLPAAVVEVPATEDARPTFAFRAVDSDTGRGLAGAKVLAMIIQDRQNMQFQTNLVTDSDGRCAVPLFSSNLMAIVVGALAEGYGERCAFLGAREPIPSGYTLKLPRGSTIAGVVQDEAGNPIANAGIQVQFYGTGDSSDREFQRERPGFPTDEFSAVSTDVSGRWRFASAPETNGNFWIEVKVPGMPSASFHTDADNRGGSAVLRLKLEDLHSGNAVLVVRNGFSVPGLVTDEREAPIANARVSYGKYFGSGPSALTTADGSFVLTGLPEGRGDITIIAGTFAPERIEIDVSAQTPPVAVRLKPGAWLRLRVIDEASNAVVHADVRVQNWRGNNTIEWGGFTDEEGHIEWSSAPRDEMDIFVGKEGFFYSRNNLLTADGEEHMIQLHPKLVLSGYVMDADSKQAITSFKAIPGSDPYNWDRHSLAEGTNGFYRVSLEEYHQPLQVRFEADGYEPAVSPPLNASQRQLVYDVELHRQDPETRVQGMVLRPDGTGAITHRK